MAHKRKIQCHICTGVEMELIDSAMVFNHRTKKRYYRRRYKCPADDEHLQTIYADGNHDQDYEPGRVERELDMHFKQEEKNEEKLRS